MSFLRDGVCSAWHHNCSKTTEGARKHFFPIFMNYGLYKSQSLTAEPYVTITRSSLFTGRVTHCMAACSQVQIESGWGAKKNAVPVPCKTCTHLQKRTAEGWNKRLSSAILTHPRDLQVTCKNYYGNIANNK